MLFLQELRHKGCFTLFPGALFLPIGFPGFPPVIRSGAKDLSVPDNFSLNAGDGVFQNGFLQLAFPDDDDGPALGFQLAPDFLVALLVPCYLGCPEIGVGLGCRGVPAVFVAIPEAAVDEDDGAVLGEDDVRGAGKAPDVHPVTETQVPEGVTQAELRLGGGGVDGGHSLVSLIW